MDPESPFASFGGGSVTDKKIGWRYYGTMLCGACKYEWRVPVTQGGASASACPHCHVTTGLVLKDGSVQEAPPTRPW